MKQYIYLPYGYATRDEILIPELGFTGQLQDKPSGCYLLGNGYRAYSPVLMRFTAPDSYSPFGVGGFHPYCYCSGDPLNKYDPTGHQGIFPPPGGFQFRGKARQVKKNVTAFYTPDPENLGATILNINAHGGRGHLWDGLRPLSIKKLSSALEENGFSLANQRTHFLSCYSASKPFWGKSVIAQMSEITNAKSTGYKGQLTAASEDTPGIDGVNVIVLVDTKNPYPPGHRYHGQFRYQPKTVSPSKIRQT